MPVGGMFSGMAVGGMWAELQVKKARYNKDLKEAETQFSKTADNIERRANRLGKNLKKAWTGVAAATAGLAATMGGAAAISGSFENALVEVQKVTDPETMRAMKTEIQGMANVIPMAQEELSKLTADAARFGVQGVENIKSFAKTTAMMTTATELSADEAGRQMARLLEWFNLAPKYAQNIGAAVNKLSNRMPGDAADIIDALGKTGQAFEVFGASTETAIALSSVIGTLSERAVRGGTRMRRVLQELGEPDKQRKVAEALGMTADEFERMKKESPVDLLKSIAKIAVQDSEAADKLSQALSSASRTALVVLGNNLDRVNEALEMTGNQLREPTSLVKEFEAAINTLFKQLQMLWNSIKNVIIVGIGDQAKNVFLAFIKNVLRPWVVTIYDILEGNEDLQQSIFQLIKAALHIGGVITLVGLAVKMFSALLSTTTLLTAGLLALGAAWRYNAFGIRDFLKESTIKSFQQMASGIKGIVDGLQAVADIDKSEVDNKLKFAWGIGQPGGDDLKDELEQTFGTGKEGMLANKILGGMRLALGLATWSWTGSAVLGVMAATVAFDWTVAPLIGGLIEDFNDAKKRWKKKKPFSDWQNFIEEMINPEETFNAPDWVKNWPPDWIDKIEEWYDGSDMERTFDLVFNFPAAFDLFKEAWNWWNNHVGKPIADWFGKDDMERTFAFGIELKGFQPFKEAWNWWNNHTGKPLFDWFVNSFTSGSALPTTGTDTGGTIPLSELGALTVEETGFFGRAKEMIDKGDIKELNNLFDNHNSSTKQQVNAINDLLSHAESVYESDNATIDSLRESIQNLADAFGRENISPHFLNYLNPEKKQSGGPMGLIPGYGGGDRVPALLEQGEFVWPKEMVKRYPGVIKGMWEGFSRGGSVTGYGVAGPGTGESNVTGALGSLEDKLEKWIKQPPSWVGDKATFTADMRALLDVVSTFSGIQDQVNKTQKEMEKQLESTRSALEELENQSGDSGEEAKTFGEWLKKNSQVMSSVVSSLSQLASQTGVFSESQSQLIQGMSNVAQSLLSGNYIQAGLDALTAVFGSYIADLKAKREELKEKLDATYSMMNQAVSQIGQKLSSLASGVLGPFRQSLSSGVNALGSFMKMIQAGGDTVEGTTSAFSALLTIATGLIGTFSSLLKKSDAWQQLQDEMEPIWKALADALGLSCNQ